MSIIGKRHVTRLCSDAYGKGIVRSQQESINLRVYSRDTDVLAAETFRTASTVTSPGIDLTRWREAIFENADYVEMLATVSVDRRNPKKGTATVKNLAFLYGHRPRNSPCWFLSAYEFMVHWSIEPVRYTTNLEEDAQNDKGVHAILTEPGRRRIEAAQKAHEKPDLQAGRDYQVKNLAPEEADWHPFEDAPFTSEYRHNWVLVRHQRPQYPTFFCIARCHAGERARWNETQLSS